MLKYIKFNYQLLVCVICILISGCVRNKAPDHPVYRTSATQFNIEHPSFSQYQSATSAWLSKNRYFLTGNKLQEIQFNSPYELPVQQVSGLTKRKGILLVHGLGDSPYYFTDIAKSLNDRGFLVRVVLLPGHGSRPADLLETEVEQWSRLVDIQINALKAEVDDVYLGGFSTGANLVTTAALHDNAIAGLILFSPAFVAKTKLAVLSPLLPWYQTWPWLKQPIYMKNIARYSPVPSNAFTQYYYTSQQVQSALAGKVFTKPVLMVLSEADSVVDAARVANLFSQRFSHKGSKLIWFGEKNQFQDSRIISLASHSKKFKVSNYSHMGVLFKPSNPYFGYPDGFRICDNGQTDSAFNRCHNQGSVWYSAWGYQEADKVHTRLTFNPQYDQMMAVLDTVLISTQ